MKRRRQRVRRHSGGGTAENPKNRVVSVGGLRPIRKKQIVDERAEHLRRLKRDLRASLSRYMDMTEWNELLVLDNSDVLFRKCAKRKVLSEQRVPYLDLTRLQKDLVDRINAAPKCT